MFCLSVISDKSELRVMTLLLEQEAKAPPMITRITNPRIFGGRSKALPEIDNKVLILKSFMVRGFCCLYQN